MPKKIILPKQKDKEGLCVVYIESTEYIDKKRKRTRNSTGIKVSPKNWSASKEKVLPNDPDHDKKNKQIDAYYSFDIAKSHEEKDTVKRLALTDYIDQYIELRKAKGTKKSSYKEFITIRNRIDRFQKSTGKIYSFDDVNLSFSDAFIIWHSSEKFDPNTINKSFVALKTVLFHYFERREELKINLSAAFQNPNFGKVTTHESPPLPLTASEFKKLIEFETDDKTLQKVADAFIFSCTTGLRFGDVHRVNQNIIKDNIIYIEPAKTETTKKNNLCKIPLNSYSNGILKKYGGSTSGLKMSNQSYNRKLKDLFKHNDLNFDETITVKEYDGLGEPVEKDYKKYELLTTHNARDTFITFCIKVGIDIPSIMDMTGHTKYETMKKYIKLDDNHLIQSMNKFNFGNLKKNEQPQHVKDQKWFDKQREEFKNNITKAKEEKTESEPKSTKRKVNVTITQEPKPEPRPNPALQFPDSKTFKKK